MRLNVVNAVQNVTRSLYSGDCVIAIVNHDFRKLYVNREAIWKTDEEAEKELLEALKSRVIRVTKENYLLNIH